jgi:hypothetical protein
MNKIQFYQTLRCETPSDCTNIVISRYIWRYLYREQYETNASSLETLKYCAVYLIHVWGLVMHGLVMHGLMETETFVCFYVLALHCI